MDNKLKEYEKWLIANQLKKNTIVLYLWHLDKFFTWLEEKKMNNKNLNAYKDYLLITRNEKINSINLQFVILNSYLKFINYNYYFDLFKQPKPDLKSLNKEQLNILLEAPLKNLTKMGLRDKVLLEILYSSGLKVYEISNILIKNIDWDKKTFIANNKNIKIDLFTWPYLKKYINKRNDDNPYLFINFDRADKNNNKPLSIRSIERVLDKYAKIINPEIKITPQILRNTLAKNLKRQTENIEEIKKTLGFKTKTATKKYLKEI